MSVSISGGCLCGAVTYSGEVEQPQTMACHCTDCQHSTSSPAATFVAVPESSFEIEGSPSSYTKKGESGQHVTRCFCRECGCQLYSHVEVMPGVFFVKLGTLDDVDDLAPQVHIWTQSSPSWDQLPEGVPAFERNPGG